VLLSSGFLGHKPEGLAGARSLPSAPCGTGDRPMGEAQGCAPLHEHLGR